MGILNFDTPVASKPDCVLAADDKLSIPRFVIFRARKGGPEGAIVFVVYDNAEMRTVNRWDDEWSATAARNLLEDLR